MAASALISATTAAATSSEFSVTLGSPVTFGINDPDGEIGAGAYAGPARVLATLEKKTAAGGWIDVAHLTTIVTALEITGAATYRVRKPASSENYGVDQG